MCLIHVCISNRGTLSLSLTHISHTLSTTNTHSRAHKYGLHQTLARNLGTHTLDPSHHPYRDVELNFFFIRCFSVFMKMYEQTVFCAFISSFFDVVWEIDSTNNQFHVYSNRILTPSKIKFQILRCCPLWKEKPLFRNTSLILNITANFELQFVHNCLNKTCLRLDEKRLKPSSFHLCIDELFQKWWTTVLRSVRYLYCIDGRSLTFTRAHPYTNILTAHFLVCMYTRVDHLPYKEK